MENWLLKQLGQLVSSCSFRENNIHTSAGILSSSALLLKLIPEHELWEGNFTRRDFYSLGKYTKNTTFFEKTANLTTRYSFLFKSLILEIKLKPRLRYKYLTFFCFQTPNTRLGFTSQKIKNPDILLREVTKGLRYTMTYVKLPVLLAKVHENEQIISFPGEALYFACSTSKYICQENIFLFKTYCRTSALTSNWLLQIFPEAVIVIQRHRPLSGRVYKTTHLNRFTDNHKNQFIANRPFTSAWKRHAIQFYSWIELILFNS